MLKNCEKSNLELKNYIRRIIESKDDSQAWEYLYLNYRGYILKIISSYESNQENRENLLQDVWVRMYKLIDSYDPKYKFSTWIGLNTVNTCNNYLKTKKRRDSMEKLYNNYTETKEQAYFESKNLSSRSFEENYCNRVLINEAMGTIKKEKELKAFKMRYLGDFSLKDIAYLLNEKDTVVKNWVYRSRDKIVQYFNVHSNDIQNSPNDQLDYT